MRSLRALVAGLAALFILSTATTTVSSAPAWAPAATASIRPGVQVRTEAGQCTSNFVFAEGDAVYLGTAAHCAGLGGSLAASGCDTESLPLGSPVRVNGASRPGRLAYSSWLTMQRVGETDPDVCFFNDLALIELDPADAGRVNPSVPHWGGPVGVSPGTRVGQAVYSYGNSTLRLGLTAISPMSGISLGDGAGGWTHDVLTVTPGLPGDSGSGFLDSRGRALGQLSTLALLPLPGTNGVGDLRRALAYMHVHSDVDAALVPGTEPFNG